MVYGLWFMVYSLWFRVQGLGCENGSITWLRVSGFGFQAWVFGLGHGFRVKSFESFRSRI